MNGVVYCSRNIWLGKSKPLLHHQNSGRVGLFSELFYDLFSKVKKVKYYFPHLTYKATEGEIVYTPTVSGKKAPISGKCKLFSSRNEKSTLSFHIPKKLIKLLLVWLRWLKLLTLNIYTLKIKISRYWSSNIFLYFHIQYGCLNNFCRKTIQQHSTSHPVNFLNRRQSFFWKWDEKEWLTFWVMTELPD